MTDAPVPVQFGITTLDVGGAENALVQIVTRLDRRFAPEVVCLQPAGPLAEPLREAGVPVHSLAMRSKRDLPRAVRRWRELLRQRPPKILQTFLFHANLIGRYCGWREGVPAVVGGIRVAERRRRGHLQVDRLTQPLVACEVCVSEDVRRFSVEVGGLDPAKLRVIPNGVDADRYARAEPVVPDWPHFDPDRPTLLFVGRLDRQKGLDILLDAVATVPGFQAILVGDGPERVSLTARIARGGLDQRVWLAGRRDGVECWCALADGFVLPSRWEGMPNALLEAMAAGLPCVATAVEGSRELLADGRGVLVEPDDPAALAEALRGWSASTPAERRATGERGQRHVREHHSWDGVARLYETLYERLLAGR